MSKICYVIMPYGGKNEALKKRYKSIFSAIIKPAAENKGYTVVREDHEARQGNISANIIKSLAEAELVIADLSGNNWNVAYELGIRHSLSKNGTILLNDNQTELMFDIQGNKVITYPYEWYDGIDETQQSIMDSINYIESNTTSSDSPVHDIYPHFSAKLIDYLSNDNDKEKAIIAKLSEENAKLKETLDSAGLSADSKTDRTDILASFRDALNRSQFSGVKATNRLQESANNEDEETFVNDLAEILSKGFLSEFDCDRIYFMCTKLDNYFVTIAFLEEIVRRYPDNEEFSGRLALVYAKSFEHREKAILTVNKNIGVKKVNNQYTIAKKPVTYNTLASFFDVYLTLDKYAELKEIVPLLIECYPRYYELIERNHVYACNGLYEYTEAEETAKTLAEKNPSAINNYSLYKVYRAADKYAMCYEQMEKCIKLEPSDSKYYMFMAGLIIDGCYIRQQNSFGNEIVLVSKQQAIAAAIPFVYEAYANGYSAQDCYAFLQKNSLSAASKEFLKYASERINPIPHNDNYDYYPLSICMS